MASPFRHHPCLRRRSPGVHNRLPAVSYTPQQVLTAYGMPKVGVVPGQRIGVVSLGGHVNPAWVRTAFAAWKLPVPRVEIMAIRGGAPNDPDPEATVENMLDVLWAAAPWSYSTGLPADVLVCSGPNSSATAVADCLLALLKEGCAVSSCSWGAAGPDWSSYARTYTEGVLIACEHGKATVCAPAGDQSLNDGRAKATMDYPGGSGRVWCCGGTSLRLHPDGSVQGETAWGDGNPNDAGGGGGFDALTPAPDWQTPYLPKGERRRLCPDSSMVSDPGTGLEVFANGQWTSVGGTSASAPLHAGWFAVAKGLLASKGLPGFGCPGPILYPAKSAFRDVVGGSNGMAAGVGMDGATGLGVPAGQAWFDAITAAQTAAGGDSPTPIAPAPPAGTPSGSPPVPTLAALLNAANHAFIPYFQAIGNGLPVSLASVQQDVDAALQAVFSPPTVAAKAVAEPRRRGAALLGMFVQRIEALVATYGPAAAPLVDDAIAASGLSAAARAILEKLAVLLLQQAAAPQAVFFGH